MPNFEDLEKDLEKKLAAKDKKRKPKMKVTGKSVFKLRELISKSHDQLPKRKRPKKNR